MNITNILNVLWQFESSASAYILVRSVTDNPCTDQECAWVYENSEGTNDDLTEQLLLSLQPHELVELTGILRDLNEELIKIIAQQKAQIEALNERVKLLTDKL